MKQPKVLILSGNKSSIKGHILPLIDHVKRLCPDTNIQFEASALARLDFYVDGRSTKVCDNKYGFDIAEFDLVVFRTIGDFKEEAMAAAVYLSHKGTRFIDEKYPIVSGQLGSILVRWDAGLSVPKTAYGTKRGLVSSLSNIGLPAVLKASNSRKGRNNYLIKSKAELRKILENNRDMRFVLQQFIPNDGDYRILIMGRQIVASLRRAKEGSHLNNVSAGGSEELVDAATIPNEVHLARKAAKKDGLQMSGVDIITDKNTNRSYILEVNRAPQLTIDAEVKSFYDLMNHIVKTKKISGKPADTIGRRVKAKLNDLGIQQIIGKIDTGAYSSSLHADNIRVEKGVLKFDITPSEYVTTKDQQIQHCEVNSFSQQQVKSSNGHLEKRYSIKTKISINRRIFIGIVTLSDRFTMGYPLLIGRKIIRSRFNVNVELDENNDKTWRF
jgi:glutathione synthase/RimK-type ligase-like ATP-grasp enzyme/CxxC motif-containing protein